MFQVCNIVENYFSVNKIEISFQHFFTAAACFAGSCFFSFVEKSVSHNSIIIS